MTTAKHSHSSITRPHSRNVTGMIRIVLVDDEPAVRQGLRMRLADSSQGEIRLGCRHPEHARRLREPRAGTIRPRGRIRRQARKLDSAAASYTRRGSWNTNGGRRQMMGSLMRAGSRNGGSTDRTGEEHK